MAQGNVYVMAPENIKNSHEIFMDRLLMATNVKRVTQMNQSDVIIAFVPVVSRAGTNIQDAMEKMPLNKQVVLVVLHHTFDPHFVAPDSRWNVQSQLVFAVDCLYHEDEGLLNCLRNDEAIKAVKQHLKLDSGYHSGGQVFGSSDLLSKVRTLDRPIVGIFIFLLFLLLYQLL